MTCELIFFCISDVSVHFLLKFFVQFSSSLKKKTNKQNKTISEKIPLKYWNNILLNALTSLKCSKNYNIMYKSLTTTVHKKVMFHLLVFILNRYHISNKHFGDDQLT